MSRVAWNKGIKQSEETRKKLSLALKGKKKPPRSAEHSKKISELKKGKPTWAKGKKFSLEHRRKISASVGGTAHWNWHGGVSPVNERVRKSVEYKIWREAVFKRDDFTCVWCKTKGGKLHADHIKRFAEFPELRFAIDNGRTLCEACHRTTLTYGNRKYWYDEATT